MTFRFSFKVNPAGITVPYAPVTDEIRHNRGFIDLRNSPHRAIEIEEGAESSALRNLLTRVAQDGSPIFTIGCELGAHKENTNVPLQRREVAGGYVQLASIKYAEVHTQAYGDFASAIADNVRSRVGTDNWKLNCVGTWVDFKFEGEPQGLRPSLLVWFFAASNTSLGAIQSRERLIEAIDKAVASTAALKCLIATGSGIATRSITYTNSPGLAGPAGRLRRR